MVTIDEINGLAVGKTLIIQKLQPDGAYLWGMEMMIEGYSIKYNYLYVRLLRGRPHIGTPVGLSAGWNARIIWPSELQGLIVTLT